MCSIRVHAVRTCRPIVTVYLWLYPGKDPTAGSFILVSQPTGCTVNTHWYVLANVLSVPKNVYMCLWICATIVSQGEFIHWVTALSIVKKLISLPQIYHLCHGYTYNMAAVTLWGLPFGLNLHMLWDFHCVLCFYGHKILNTKRK